MMPAGNTPRLLFVIDNDFGELAMARFFLHGQVFARQALLAVPPRLSAAAEGSTVPVREYRSADELDAIIDDAAPDLVLLFSGYLLPVHGLVPVAALRALCTRLRAAGCPVLTYDPFWSLMADPRTAFGGHAARSGGPLLLRLARLGLAQLSPTMRAFEATATIVRELTHVTPAPDPDARVATLPFFNRRLLDLPATVPSPTPELVGGEGPYWLFVLGGEDYARQRKRHGGPDAFARMIAKLFDRTEAAGRRPVLLAPEECGQLLQHQRLPAATRVLPYCGFNDFLTAFLGAEYVFFWNAISSSSVARIVNGLPLFFFDAGHVGARLAPVLDRTIKLFYMGWQPTYLAEDDDLDPEVLRKQADAFRAAATTIRNRLRFTPTPEELVAGALGRTSQRAPA